MKRPIEASEIRKGDLIRTEAVEGAVIGDNLTASEWRADGSEDARYFNGVHLFLLDRPEPAVELPTNVATGHLSWTNNAGDSHTVFAGWQLRDYAMHSDLGHYVAVPNVTAFTPATAVPTAALDRLRAYYYGNGDACYDSGATRRQVGKFLAAVDEANA